MNEDTQKDSKGRKAPPRRRAGRDPAGATAKKKPRPARPDPTRYGDWEKGGRCIDF